MWRGYGRGGRAILSHQTHAPLLKRADSGTGQFLEVVKLRPNKHGALMRQDNATHILQQNEQVHWISKGWHEIEMFIELPGLLVLGVDRKRTNARNFGGLEGAQHGVPE